MGRDLELDLDLDLNADPGDDCDPSPNPSQEACWSVPASSTPINTSFIINLKVLLSLQGIYNIQSDPIASHLI
jgi:hypothetical protein